MKFFYPITTNVPETLVPAIIISLLFLIGLPSFLELNFETAYYVVSLISSIWLGICINCIFYNLIISLHIYRYKKLPRNFKKIDSLRSILLWVSFFFIMIIFVTFQGSELVSLFLVPISPLIGSIIYIFTPDLNSNYIRMFNIQINSSIDINQIKSLVIKSYMGGFPPFNEEFSKEIAGEILKNSIISEKILTLKSISLNTVVTFQKEFGEIDQTFKVFL